MNAVNMRMWEFSVGFLIMNGIYKTSITAAMRDV